MLPTRDGATPEGLSNMSGTFIIEISAQGDNVCPSHGLGLGWRRLHEVDEVCPAGDGPNFAGQGIIDLEHPCTTQGKKVSIMVIMSPEQGSIHRTPKPAPTAFV